MRKYIFAFLLLALFGCAPGMMEMPTLRSPMPDLNAEVERFLNTDDAQVEEQVLSRLRRAGVSNGLLRPVLKAHAETTPANKPRGSQTGLSARAAGGEYLYALHVPETPEPGKPLPMIVVLHGAGSTGDDILATWVERLNGEFIVACPSYPMGAWWAKNAEDLVLEVIRKTRADYPVDPSRVFIAGLSNGAIGAYMIGMFYPDLFAGIAPIAGTITPRYMHFLVNLRNTPVYTIQGVYDPIFPIMLSRRVNKILSDMNYPVVYREHEEKGLAHGGHFLPESEIPALVAWLKQQARNPLPERVRLTREANHLGRVNWVRLSRGENLAALELPGPEGAAKSVKDGKIATLFAHRKENNRFEVSGKHLIEFELYLNADMVDFDRPIEVTTQEIIDQGDRLMHGEKVLRFQQRVDPDIEVLLRGFKAHRDPENMYDARVTVSLEKTLARLSGP